jgi:hypothetical protein
LFNTLGGAGYYPVQLSEIMGSRGGRTGLAGSTSTTGSTGTTGTTVAIGLGSTGTGRSSSSNSGRILAETEYIPLIYTQGK